MNNEAFVKEERCIHHIVLSFLDCMWLLFKGSKVLFSIAPPLTLMLSHLLHAHPDVHCALCFFFVNLSDLFMYFMFSHVDLNQLMKSLDMFLLCWPFLHYLSSSSSPNCIDIYKRPNTLSMYIITAKTTSKTGFFCNTNFLMMLLSQTCMNCESTVTQYGCWTSSLSWCFPPLMLSVLFALFMLSGRWPAWRFLWSHVWSNTIVSNKHRAQPTGHQRALSVKGACIQTYIAIPPWC